ncbi:selenium-dependent molybdenum cofactor biosynthesis protein YqeB [Clostridium polynesiense]|uniref:selenium-dependent molybdenum cofactor biosynthesis protein YqeB n=1 Tax=Clostridium polynesiense TaxID=1325933 RepID=UPI00058FEDCA|nr:selenium-dependent molybdenum cofactor biosynthesis protein YqeB [Clostridium polynesiense]
MNKFTVIIRGGGDLASGIIQKLHRSGFKVLVLEIKNPTAIRRAAAFSEAIYVGEVVLEGIKAVKASSLEDVEEAWNKKEVPVAVDEEGKYIELIKPKILVDAIIAKKNLGTKRDMADITIAVGPGFTAGEDVDAVIESMRGHNLGRIIFKGQAQQNTGIPGNVQGFSKERVIYSPYSGVLTDALDIGTAVNKEEVIAYIGGKSVKASITGILRGILRSGSIVAEGTKLADIDPRMEERDNCFTISDKARSIGGGVLEAVLYLLQRNQEKG